MHSLTLFVCVLLIGSEAHAQAAKDTPLSFVTKASGLNGRWSSGDCASKWYDWSVSDREISFRDQSGNLDVERVVQVYPDGFVTRSVAANHTLVGVSWSYQLLTPNRVRVQNLSNQTSFLQERCPPAGLRFAGEAADKLGQTRKMLQPSAPASVAPEPTVVGHNQSAASPVAEAPSVAPQSTVTPAEVAAPAAAANPERSVDTSSGGPFVEGAAEVMSMNRDFLAVISYYRSYDPIVIAGTLGELSGFNARCSHVLKGLQPYASLAKDVNVSGLVLSDAVALRLPVVSMQMGGDDSHAASFKRYFELAQEEDAKSIFGESDCKDKVGSTFKYGDVDLVVSDIRIDNQLRALLRNKRNDLSELDIAATSKLFVDAYNDYLYRLRKAENAATADQDTVDRAPVTSPVVLANISVFKPIELEIVNKKMGVLPASKTMPTETVAACWEKSRLTDDVPSTRTLTDISFNELKLNADKIVIDFSLNSEGWFFRYRCYTTRDSRIWRVEVERARYGYPVSVGFERIKEKNY